MLVSIPQHIDLDHTFRCGQAFRWVKQEEWYFGVIYGVFLKMRDVGKKNREGAGNHDTNSVIEVLWGGDQEDAMIRGLLHSYFRLDDNYHDILEHICRDDYVKSAVKKYRGLRLLRQEPWECLISYLCSAMNNIGQIAKCIDKMSEKFGTPVTLGKRTQYSFPSIHSLGMTSEEELRKCGTGFRAKFISKVARNIMHKKSELEKIFTLPYSSAKKELMKFNGVGEKIADCVLAFSMDKTEAFPVDRWMRRAMMEQYGDDIGEFMELEKIKKMDDGISRFARAYFGPNAAYAQEFIFYFRRV